VKKQSTLESLVTLILALHQEYLSTLKVLRVKNQVNSSSHLLLKPLFIFIFVFQALGDVPLTIRAPSTGNTSKDEQKTAEDWENAVELSQLGQVLSCRLESRNFKPLMFIMNYVMEILKLVGNIYCIIVFLIY